ncbi:hypothetical protein [Sporosarcina sp. 6E9]|uniref:hypothetical protein n=1 Tax=Sporosarcina sp. 6E9 TaxID=2819235 RepID=UPI001B3038DE|nr:hypothetical protein [Sporosarcina sp. 6E9]
MKITLYHGTSKERGSHILADGKIKAKNINRVYDENHIMPTSDGYVYLTKDIALAVYYANLTAVTIDRDTQLMIFKLELYNYELEADLDEIKYTLNNKKEKERDDYSVKDSLKLTASVRYPHDVLLKDNKVKYTVKTSTLIEGTNRIGKEEANGILKLRGKNSDKAIASKQDYISKCIWK